jgi:hypothetical protein
MSEWYTNAWSAEISVSMIFEYSVHIIGTECLVSTFDRTTRQLACMRYATFHSLAYDSLQYRLGWHVGDCSAGQDDATAHVLPFKELPFKGTCSLLRTPLSCRFSQSPCLM